MRTSSTARSQWLAGAAASMRRAPTRSERLFWEAVSGKRLLGVAFRRQVVIADRYIVDFAAPAKKLVVEIDGGYHRDRERADGRRDRALEQLGWRVLRLDSAEVEKDLGGALLAVRQALGAE